MLKNTSSTTIPSLTQSKRTNLQNTPLASSSAYPTLITTITIVKGKLAKTPETIQVKQGETISWQILSDEEGELHLHGYNKSVDLKKNLPTTLTFTANLTGHFTYELENTHTELGALEVLPQ